MNAKWRIGCQHARRLGRVSMGMARDSLPRLRTWEGRETFGRVRGSLVEVIVAALVTGVCALMVAGCGEKKPNNLPGVTKGGPTSAVANQPPSPAPAKAQPEAKPNQAASPTAAAPSTAAVRAAAQPAPPRAPQPEHATATKKRADVATKATASADVRERVQDQLVAYMQLTRKTALLPLGARREGEVLSVAVATRGQRPVVDRLITTKDGRILLENALDLDQQIRRLGNDRRFVGCLMNAGVRLFINSTNALDRRQLAVIGQFSNSIRTDCARAGKAECAKLKIKKTPMWLIGTTRVEGAKPRSWLEAATTCK